MRVRRPVVAGVVGAAAGAALIAGVLTFAAASSQAPPSAQCRGQLHQVAAFQADAEAIQNSSVVVANGELARFNHDVDSASRLLKVMKSENCPNGGY
jgi:hypothetical protein